MKRRTLKLLMLLTLTIAFALAPATMSGNTKLSHESSISSPSSRTTKQKHARKNRALAVLREYLPSYADILEAKTLRFEDILFNGGSLIPIDSDFDVRSPFINPMLRLKTLHVIEDWLGTRYRYAGVSRNGVDCSGFTSAVLREAMNKRFNGSSSSMARQFTPLHDLDSLQFGDLLFFTGTSRTSNRIGHVGIYLGNGVFAHSSSSVGVTINHISDGYYQRRFRWAGRFTTTPAADAEKHGVFVLP